MKFLDQAKIHIESGNGGNGCVSFRREKYVEFGGPNGGNGGKGGNVIIKCVDGLNTLIDYRYRQHFKAKNGNPGMGSDKTGRSGEDTIIEVPRGTLILEEDNEGIETELDVVEGMQFDRGYLSPYFITNSDKMTTELENPFIDRKSVV